MLTNQAGVIASKTFDACPFFFESGLKVYIILCCLVIRVGRGCYIDWWPRWRCEGTLSFFSFSDCVFWIFWLRSVHFLLSSCCRNVWTVDYFYQMWSVEFVDESVKPCRPRDLSDAGIFSPWFLLQYNKRVIVLLWIFDCTLVEIATNEKEGPIFLWLNIAEENFLFSYVLLTRQPERL